MAEMKPFLCIRPNPDVVDRVAALPYDVFNREEAKREVEREPMSFLRIDRAETLLSDEVDAYDERVYQKAKETLDGAIADGTYVRDEEESFFVYELTMNERSQTGIVACASIDDYLNQVIKKHENTREDKEFDRIKHVDVCGAQTGPIFLTYQASDDIMRLTGEVKKEEPIYDFTKEDGVRHTVWRVKDKKRVDEIKTAFDAIGCVYIADGHHRAASAVKVGLKRRRESPNYTGKEEFNYFLSVLFPHDQLNVMGYNRTVKDLNGLSEEEFLNRLKDGFHIEKSDGPCQPMEKATFGMYLNKRWYRLKPHEELRLLASKDEVESLDVSLLQKHILNRILGIVDPRTDDRIDFIGGIRGLKELERRVDTDMAVAFSLYPTSVLELFAVSDAGKLMPPKSTWFEPKLRSGIFIHQI